MDRQWNAREWYEYGKWMYPPASSSSSSSRAVIPWAARTAGRIDSEHNRNPSAHIGGLKSERAQTEKHPDTNRYNCGGRVHGQTCNPALNIEKHVRYINGAPVLVSTAR